VKRQKYHSNITNEIFSSSFELKRIMFRLWHTLILGSPVEFNGSSINVLSRNSMIQIEREFAMVDGRGKFRMARGFANLKCTFFHESNGDSIVEYKVVVRHY
jgi:hypothetical protein